MRFHWLPLLTLLAACPPVVPDPADDDDAAAEPEPWLVTAEVLDIEALPVAGATLAVGDDVRVTDASGVEVFEVDAGPPAQVDFGAGDEVDSRVTCYGSERFWDFGDWTYVPPETSITVTIDAIESPEDFRFAWVFEYADFDWVSTWTYPASSFEEGPDGWTLTLGVVPAARWAAFAAEPRDGEAWWARVDGDEPLEDGDEASVTLALSASGGGTQAWDGDVPEGVTVVELKERVEVWGEAVWLSVGTFVGGEEVALPVYDGSLDVLEYRAEATWDVEGCDAAATTKTLAPLFPPDVLTLGELPRPPEFGPVGGDWSASPDLWWSAPDANSASTYLYAWDADGAFASPWSVRVQDDCDDVATWPATADPMGSGWTVDARLYAYFDGASGRCTVSGVVP